MVVLYELNYIQSSADGDPLQALQDGALMRYLAQSKEHSVVQKFVADYAESILRSVKTADLLFQTSDEGSAAWCYRMPEQLVNFCCMFSKMSSLLCLCDTRRPDQLCSL